MYSSIAEDKASLSFLLLNIMHSPIVFVGFLTAIRVKNRGWNRVLYELIPPSDRPTIHHEVDLVFRLDVRILRRRKTSRQSARSPRIPARKAAILTRTEGLLGSRPRQSHPAQRCQLDGHPRGRDHYARLRLQQQS